MTNIAFTDGAFSKPYRIGFSGSDGLFLSYFGWLPQKDIFIYVVGNNGEHDVKPVIGAAIKALQVYAGVKPKDEAVPVPASGKAAR
jgi:hypothetical protein